MNEGLKEPKMKIGKSSSFSSSLKKKPLAKKVEPEETLALPPPKKKKLREKPTVDDVVEESSDSNEEESAPKLLPGVSKTTLRRLNSMFGQRSDTIIAMLETTDTDGAASLVTRTLLQTLVDVLPVVERNVRRSKGARGVMPLNQVISQVRELLHDIQAYKDRDALADSLIDRHLRPAFLDLAMQMSNLMVELDNRAKANMKSGDYDKYHTTAENMRASLADFMRRQFDQLSTSVRASL